MRPGSLLGFAALVLLRQIAPAAEVESADRLQWGHLSFASCLIGSVKNGLGRTQALCTQLDVPEDWAHPDGRHIRLHVAMLRAQQRASTAAPVLFLDGGPGGAATEDYPAIAGGFEILQREHTIVLMDQRGTGSSSPLDCPDADAAIDDTPGAPNDAGIAAAARRCLQQLGTRAAPQFYTTTATLRDLEALRAALGVAQLNVVGVSYGTRVAQQYAQHYPQAVRALVLDSAVPNRVALGADHARNLENALQAQLARCRTDAACFRRFGDPWQSLRMLRAQLRTRPVQVTLRDPVTYEQHTRTLGESQLVSWARIQAYNPLTVALLPLAIDDALHGDYTPLFAQQQVVVGGVSEALNGALGLSVSCAEDEDLLQAGAEDADTLLGHSLLDYLHSACRVWPRGTRPADFHEPLGGAVPTLVLAGEFDPVTPPDYGREVVKGIRGARLLLVPGQGHAVLTTGCMPRLVGEFMRTLDAAALRADCLRALGPQPFLLDHNGSAP